MNLRQRAWRSSWLWLGSGLALAALVYWPGLSGGWLFDDYPNIVNNVALHAANWQLTTLLNAALSSTSGVLERPLASLSFALNFLTSGLDPYAMKLTNLLVHLLNGALVFLLARTLMSTARVGAHPVRDALAAGEDTTLSGEPSRALGRRPSRTGCAPTDGRQLRVGVTAALIATGWMVLPINLTGVLYVVQRMESLANVFVLLGLLGYTIGRRRMLADATCAAFTASGGGSGWGGFFSRPQRGFVLCAISLTVPTTIGVMAKESAVLLPLYAAVIEWALFHMQRGSAANTATEPASIPTLRRRPRDWHIAALFAIVLVLPMIVGLAWLLPGVFNPQAWITRDFTLRTRLLSEARIVLDYVHWTLLPSSHALSFYHDDFIISRGWLTPWTTLASALGLLVLAGFAFWVRPRAPLVALGVAWFFAAQALTGTVLPLELIYEHRNYFASFGLLLALIPLLAVPAQTGGAGNGDAVRVAWPMRALPYPRLRYTLLAALLLAWTMQTALGAYIWGSPLRLTRELAARSPDSPRAQYDLGRSYSIYSNYDPASPFTPMAYAALEHAATLPKSSILPEQALIFMSARMGVPAKAIWWDSLIAKLKARPASAQDDGALVALSTCAVRGQCELPAQRMMAAFTAILSHPQPGAQLQARYGEYAWNVLHDRDLGYRMTALAVTTEPREPRYRIALMHMLVAEGRTTEASSALHQLEALNVGGRLDRTLQELRALPGMH